MLTRGVAMLVLVSAACHARAPAGPRPWSGADDIDEHVDDLRARHVLIARTGDPPCADDGADCEPACAAGNGWACTSAAEFHRASGDQPGAVVRFVAACKHHDPDGCAEAALLRLAVSRGDLSIADGGAAVDFREDPYSVLYEACTKYRSVRACTRGTPLLDAFEWRWWDEFGVSWSHHNPDREIPIEAMVSAMSKVGCELGDGPQCLQAGAWDRACTLGVDEGCTKAKEHADAVAEDAARRAYDATPEGQAAIAERRAREDAEAAEAAAARAASDAAWQATHVEPDDEPAQPDHAAGAASPAVPDEANTRMMKHSAELLAIDIIQADKPFAGYHWISTSSVTWKSRWTEAPPTLHRETGYGFAILARTDAHASGTLTMNGRWLPMKVSSTTGGDYVVLYQYAVTGNTDYLSVDEGGLEVEYTGDDGLPSVLLVFEHN